jgi:hypothetical protein
MLRNIEKLILVILVLGAAGYLGLVWWGYRAFEARRAGLGERVAAIEKCLADNPAQAISADPAKCSGKVKADWDGLTANASFQSWAFYEAPGK